jgi:hypothetical protein
MGGFASRSLGAVDPQARPKPESEAVWADPALVSNAAILLVGLTNRASEAFAGQYVVQSSFSLVHLGSRPVLQESDVVMRPT